MFSGCSGRKERAAMDEALLKKERRSFEKRVFFTSLALSAPLSLLFWTRSPGEALAFFLSQLVVAADIVLLSELSGSMLEKGGGSGARIAASLLLKLVLLLGGLYVILSLFYSKPLGLFAGFSLPPGAALFWALRDAGKS